MPRPWLVRLEDMLNAIDHIETIGQNNAETILARLAFERAFEILSEASRHIPSDIKGRFCDIRWQDLADLGNIIRHAYDRVSLETLQETARTDVPPLKHALLAIKSGA